MKNLRLMFLLAAILPLAHGQQCAVSFNLAAAGSSAAFNNLTRGCVNWTVTFNSTGFSALTFTVQTAPNNAGVPGAWSTFTAASGSNPSTAITQASATFAGYFPFVRVTLSGLTGTGAVSGLLYGSATDYGAGGGGATTTVVGPDAPGTPSTANPVQVAGNDGTDVRAIRTDTTGNTQVTGPAANGAAAVDRPLIIGGIRAGAATARSVTTILTGAQEAIAVAAGINTSNGHQPIAVDFSGGIKVSPQGTALADDFSNTVGLQADSATNGIRQNVFPMVFDGTTWDRMRGNSTAGLYIGGRGTGASQTLYGITACDSSAVISAAAGTTVELATGAVNNFIRVCSFVLSADTAASTAQFVYGTGSTCGTGTTNLTGAMHMGAGSAMTVGDGLGELFKAGNNTALCLAAVTGAVTGVVTYARY